jgi:murein DD-endopeptidase MepM/ murein hydrolase activator NlpD
MPLWLWPTGNCPITQPFIPGRHLGVDIGCPTGTPIVATRDGTVSVAAFDSGGYGWWIELDHGDGTTSRYGHQPDLVHGQGDALAQGALLGYVDTTGNATGPHLHFEIRVNGVALDPLPLLSGTPNLPPASPPIPGEPLPPVNPPAPDAPCTIPILGIRL